MRVCNQCGLLLDDEAFSWRFKSRNIRNGRCKECVRPSMRDHYRRNKETYLLKAKEWNTREKRERQALADDIKRRPCTDCGKEFPPCAMDFDHLDPKLKSDSISSLVNRCAPIEEIMEEISKCEVVCANCHRIRTHKMWDSPSLN